MLSWRRFLADESGTTTVEYCVVLFFIITACLVGISAVGSSGGGLWGKNVTEIQSFL